jgi:hypothetical protein
LGVVFFGQRHHRQTTTSLFGDDPSTAKIDIFSPNDAVKKAQWRDEWERTYPVMHALTSMDPTPIAPSEILAMLDQEHRDIVEEVIVDIKETQSLISPHDIAWKLQAMYRRRSKAFLLFDTDEDTERSDTRP